jgi:NTE family protein
MCWPGVNLADVRISRGEAISLFSDNPGVNDLIDGPALALSGGGYRALLFHLGALWRLNELGWMRRLLRIDGVSGGAVVAAWLGLKWRELHFDASGVAVNFEELVARPLCRLASRVLDIPVGLAALAWPVSALPYALAHHLFSTARLSELPDGNSGPQICALATNLLTGSLVELSARGIRDDFLGECSAPGLALATAIAASCSIPPSFRPVWLRIDARSWRGECAPGYERTRRAMFPLMLADGGNYDNQALSNVCKRYRTVLVSDGSAPMPSWSWVSGDWLTATLRSNRVLIDQVRLLHQRILRDLHYRQDTLQRVAYWAVASRVCDYGAAEAMPCDGELTLRLSRTRTRMGRYTPQEQGLLINWGYSACDAALRAELALEAAPPRAWPVPAYPLAG